MNKPKSESSHSIEAHLAALYGRINYERQIRVTPRHFKLRNMHELLQRLGNPQQNYPIIHVAGTKGKGSVCTMVGQILTTSSRRTGVYTSPHLEKINQRMAIDGQLISDDQLVQVLSSLDPVVREMDAEAEKQDLRPLTFFEITTAAAFYFFAIEQCDAVVLEVGLGGRMDSTNICQPFATVITNISLDHTRQLGSTVDKIAFEKAGIIKPTVPVISGATDPVAAAVIADVAAEKEAPLFLLGNNFRIESSLEPDQGFTCSGQVMIPFLPKAAHPHQAADERPGAAFDFTIPNLKLSLIGQHQRDNAALAVTTIKTLNARGWSISDEVIRTGLQQASLPGRAELVHEHPTVIIDIAHNVASIEALVHTVRTDLPQWKSSPRRTLIFATSRDKDAPGMLRPLIESFDEILLTKYQDNPRGKDETELLEVAEAIQAELRNDARQAANVATVENPTLAWARVFRELKPDHVVCISGSAFLVAELRNTILASFESQIVMVDA